MYLSPLFGFGYGYPWYGHYYGGWGYGGYAPWVYSDYGYYDSPYYVTDGVVVDESVVVESPPETSEQAELDGERFLVQAENAFRQGQYQESVMLIKHAMVELPTDGRVMLFLSQTLFAVGDYQEAITATYRGMSLLDPKDWGCVVTNYTKYYGNDDYPTQMKQLDSYIKANPQAGYAYALRGYQWGYLSYQENAQADLGKALELESRDHYAKELLVKFGGKEELPEPTSATPETATPETGAPEIATPENAIPEIAEPETPEPEAAAPETTEPEKPPTDPQPPPVGAK